MDGVFRYFWFWSAAFWIALTFTMIRPRLLESVRRGSLTARQAADFGRGLLVVILSLSLIQGLIGLMARYPSPLCVRPFDFSDGASTASNLVMLAAWFSLLAWVWIGSGDTVLGRVAPALINPPNYTRVYSPRRVRAVVTLLLGVMAAGSYVGSRSVPPDPRCRSSVLAQKSHASTPMKTHGSVRQP